jgi:hypothetical protein
LVVTLRLSVEPQFNFSEIVTQSNKQKFLSVFATAAMGNFSTRRFHFELFKVSSGYYRNRSQNSWQHGTH